MAEVLALDGSLVQAGQPLFRLENRELELQIEAAQAQLAGTEAMLRRALGESTADLKPLESRAEATRQFLDRLLEAQQSLLVRAPHAGLWVAPQLNDIVGSWLERGFATGQLIDTSSFYFSAIVSQNEASRLFTDEIRKTEVKVYGQADQVLPVRSQKVIPADRQNLPSAAVGWAGGGEIAVDMNDQSGTRATEPFFEVRAHVDLVEPVTVLHGRGGRIRFDLPPEPLLHQWIRKFRQLLQSRYGI